MNLFITGGSRGIGHNIMMAALTNGNDVAFTYRNPETDVDAIVQEANKIAPNQRCKGYQLDVAQSTWVDAVAEQVVDDFGEIDVVVNNAAVTRDNLLFTMSNEAWQEVIDTNLSGPFYVMRSFLPIFLANRNGRFITISSVAKDGSSGQANYSASKSGLVGLSGTMAKEYGRKGITSNVIVPGMFETDMVRKMSHSETKDFWLSFCPLKRAGKLEEVSALVLFLASDGASFINGQVISVTGGLDWVS